MSKRKTIILSLTIIELHILFRQLRESHVQLEAELKGARADYSALETNVNEYQSKIVQLEELILKQSDSKIEHENQTIAELKTQIALNEADKVSLADVSDKVSKLSSEIESYREEKIKLQEDINEKTEKLCVAEADNAILRKQVESVERSMKERLSEKNVVLAEVSKQLEDSRKSIQQLEFQIAETATRAGNVDILRKDNEALNERLQSKVNENKNLMEELESIRTDKIEKDAELIQNLRTEIDKLNTRISVFEDEEESLEKENKAMLHASKKQIIQISDLQKQLSEESAALRSKTKELEIARIAGENLEIDVGRLRLEIADSKTKIEAFEKEKEILEKENERNMVQLKELQKELDAKSCALQSKIKECEKKSSELKSAGAAQENLEKQIKEFLELKNSFESLEKEMAAIAEEKSKLEAERKNLKIQIDNQNQCIEELNKDINYCSMMEINSKNAEIRSLTERMSRAEELYNNLLKSQSDDKGASKRLSCEGKPAKRSSGGCADIDHLMKENRELKSSHQRLEHELDELRASSRQTRKSKRQSAHDDTRRISGFDWNTNDAGIQTDPSSELCRCSEFVDKIDQLKRDIVIKDSKYNTLKANAGIEVAKLENDELKKVHSKLFFLMLAFI